MCHRHTLRRRRPRKSSYYMSGTFVVLNFLRTPHATPPMVDKNVIFRVNVIITIHNEASDMSKAIDPAWIPRKSIVTSLKHDLRSSLEPLGIQNYFLHALVVIRKLDQGAKELVSKSAFQLLGISLVHAFLEEGDFSLNEMG